MANIKSAKKRILQIEKRTLVNRNRRSRIRTFMRKVEEAIETGKQKEAQDALRLMQREMMKGVSKGIMRLNTAARKISRTSARIKALAS